jgi:asparagine synthetase B (glutamine-hydrolysing)
MCNINLILNKNRKIDKEILKVMNVISYHSYLFNSDGEGFLSMDKRIVKFTKSKQKIIYKDLNCFLLATHQRLATSGKTKSNIHPYETKDLVLMHNGIFNEMGNDRDSDTKQYTTLMQKLYEKNKGNIIKTIQQISLKVSGSYSIIVYEKSSGRLFYYKDSHTNMYSVSNKDYLVLSTIEDNVKYAQRFFGIKSQVKSVEPYVIYDVLDNFKDIGMFKDCVNTEKIVTNESKTKTYTYETKQNYNIKDLEDFLIQRYNPYDLKIKKDWVKMELDKKEFEMCLNDFNSCEILSEVKNPLSRTIKIDLAEVVVLYELHLDEEKQQRNLMNYWG